MTFTGDDVLDGRVAVRSETVRFDVVDLDGNVTGTLMVNRDRAPQITNDVGRTIRRTVSGIEVQPRPLVDVDASHIYAEDLSTLSTRVRVTWVLGTGDEYPLGLFLWGDDSATVWTWGSPRSGSLVDQMQVLNDPLEVSIGYGVGQNIHAALVEQVEAAGFDSTRYSIETSSLTLTQPVAWAAGRDTRVKVIESLCALAGFLPPYFSNDELLVCRAAPDLASAAADFTYGTGGVVLDGSIVTSSDILSAPNRYQVIDTSQTATEIVGIFDVPDAAPNSYVNTGRRITRTIELQGLASTTAANDAAAAAYVADQSTYSWLSFETTPDPRNDTFDVIDFDGTLYLQLSWRLVCEAGGRMAHECRGTYQ